MLPLPLAPWLTIALLTAGIALIYLEFNRPGLIVAGAAGLLSLLIGLASVARFPHPALKLALLAACAALLAWDDRRPSPLLTILAFAALSACFLLLSHGVVDGALGQGCAVAIALGTHRLNRIAYRARVNKGHGPASKV